MKRKLQLGSLELLGWRFGLQTIQALLDELGHPELSFKIIHVAGSNGKGSTCAYMASFLKQCGFKTGLYTSPHLCEIRERFRLNGTWISPRDFKRHTHKILNACLRVEKKLGHLPTHFEALTAIAFSWFKEQKAEWVVLEVGLGGRLDATNVLETTAVSLIAPISLEHEDILGHTLSKIAKEKAGILKKGCLAASVQYHAEVSKTIDQIARRKGAQLMLAGRNFYFQKQPGGFSWKGNGFQHRFHLKGIRDFQIPNAALAVAGIQCLKAFGIERSPKEIERALASMRWPGRVEEIDRFPLTVLDGAHNPEAAQSLFVYLKNRYPHKRWIILNGFLKDKNYASFTRIVAPLTDLSIVTEPNSPRAQKGKWVLEEWEKNGVQTLLVRDWKLALALSLSKVRQSPTRGLLITGSLYLVGDCRKKCKGISDLATI